MAPPLPTRALARAGATPRDPIAAAERAFNRLCVPPNLASVLGFGLSLVILLGVWTQAVWWGLGFTGLSALAIVLLDVRRKIRFEAGWLVISRGNRFGRQERLIHTRDIHTVELTASIGHRPVEVRGFPGAQRSFTFYAFRLTGPNLDESLEPLPLMESFTKANRLRGLLDQAVRISSRGEAPHLVPAPVPDPIPDPAARRAPARFHMSKRDETLEVRWGLWPRRGFTVTPDGIALRKPRQVIDVDRVLSIELRPHAQKFRVLAMCRRGERTCLAELSDRGLAERVAQAVRVALRLPAPPAPAAQDAEPG